MTDSEKLDLILSKFEKLDKVENDVAVLVSEMQELKQRMENVEQRTASTENSVTEVKLILENEIRVNIQRVAEGHLDLSRNLHEALKIDSEKEMLVVRVNVLESELRRIKTRLQMA